MTVGALVLAVAAAVVTGLFTLYATQRNTNETGRTAARLIYAELTRNSAPVAYYLGTGVWPQAGVESTVWNGRSESVAKIREADVFNTIFKGYAALETIAFLGRQAEGLGAAGQDILRERVAQLQASLKAAGALGRIADGDVESIIGALTVPQTPVVPGARPAPPWVPGVVPQQVIENILRRGTPAQRESAEQSLQRAAPATPGAAPPPVHRTVYDAAHEMVTSGGVIARDEGAPATGDPAVDEVYDAMGATHAFYWEAFGHDLHEDAGTPLGAVVHYGKQYNNAFWDGRQFIVGDGDGVLFNRFSVSTELVAHELTHALVQRAGLAFRNQAGALTESICDVFGVLAAQYLHGQTSDEADWLFGVGLLGPQVHGVALRSLKAPGTAYDDPVLGRDPQVAHLRDYVHTTEDNGGVRVNCGIPSRAFYLTASHLGGHAWERAGRVWFEAVRSGRLRPGSGFVAFAGITLAVAERLYGESSPEVDAVRDGWEQVGVRPRDPRRPEAGD